MDCKLGTASSEEADVVYTGDYMQAFHLSIFRGVKCLLAGVSRASVFKGS